MRIAVAGAGPGGLAAANALARAGIDVEVFEQAPRLRDDGGPLVLWPYATRHLPALTVAHHEISHPLSRSVVRAWDGRCLRELPAGALGPRHGAPILALLRGDLVRSLAARRSVPIHFGRGVSGFVEGGRHVRLQLTDGTSEDFDGLIGVDGLHSVVRAALHGASPPRPARMYAWLGAGGEPVPRTETGLLTTYVGEGRRFLHIPAPGGRVWWYAYTHASLPVADPADLRVAFRGWASPVLDAIDATDPRRVLRVSVSDRPTLPVWGRGRVTLLGDAAHPCTPDLGQGACMALDDAVTLAEQARPDVDAWFRAYEGARTRRTETLQAASWVASQASFPGAPVACQLRDAMFAAAPEHAMRIGFDWISAGRPR